MATDPDWRKRKRNQRSDKVIFSDDTMRQIEEMSSLGMTRGEICQVLGISMQTLRRREVDHPGLTGTLDSGKSRANMSVTKAAHKMATSARCWPATIGWLERHDPERWADPSKNNPQTIPQALKNANGELLTGRQLVEKLRKELDDYEASLPKELEKENPVDADFTKDV